VEVEPLDSEYFLINKTYATTSPADRLIFLDADTLVLQSLDSLWETSAADFIGRVTSAQDKPGWNPAAWSSLLRQVGVTKAANYYNSGFVIFQNQTHRSIAQLWRDFTRGGRDASLFYPPDLGAACARHAEQVALSMAVAAAGLRTERMGSTDHAYGWAYEPHGKARVYHTGGPGYFNYASLLNVPHNLRLASPIVTSRTNRLYLQTQAHLNWARIKMGLKKVVNGRLTHRRSLSHK
jgi:hypothetical protein